MNVPFTFCVCFFPTDCIEACWEDEIEIHLRLFFFKALVAGHVEGGMAVMVQSFPNNKLVIFLLSAHTPVSHTLIRIQTPDNTGSNFSPHRYTRIF